MKEETCRKCVYCFERDKCTRYPTIVGIPKSLGCGEYKAKKEK